MTLGKEGVTVGSQDEQTGTPTDVSGTAPRESGSPPPDHNGHDRAEFELAAKPVPETGGLARCSIIIPVHNRASLTRQCLNVLLAQRDPNLDREIIVIDDASRDLTPRLLTAFGDRIRVITHETAQGFAAACNAGAAAAAGDYLVFLNNDTVPRANWLTKLATYAQAHPRGGGRRRQAALPERYGAARGRRLWSRPLPPPPVRGVSRPVIRPLTNPASSRR